MAEENITPQDAVTSPDAGASPDAADETTVTDDAANGVDATSGTDTGAESPAPEGSVIVPQPELNDALASSTDENAPRREVEGGRSYEIIFITRAGDPDATDTATNRLRDLIEGNGGAVDNVRTSETRRLAYSISKEIEGIYTVVNGRFTTDRLAELDRFFKLEESVLRHMILKQDE